MNRLFLYLISASSLLLVSCGKTQSDLENFITQTKKNGSAQVKALPDYVAYEKFTYISDGVRDPFVLEVDVPVIEVQESNDEFAPDTNRKKEPLEQFPLDTLQMVGTLENKDKWVLIRTAEGDIHRVKKGNYIGQNFGEVIEVTDNKVVVKEVIKDGLGDWIERTAIIAMGE